MQNSTLNTPKLDKDAIRRSLVDVHGLCEALGLLEGSQKQARGLIVRCPWHNEKTPSCSLQVRDGITAHCFGCDARGDVFALIAAAKGFDLKTNFAAVLELAADIAGGANRFEQGSVKLAPVAALVEERTYPPIGEVEALWAACTPVDEDKAVAAYLRSRTLNPSTIVDRDLARALPPKSPCPTWARFQGKSWAESGHRIVVPAYDHMGAIRSLRGWNIEGNEVKRVGPAGHKLGGLALVDNMARLILASGGKPEWWPNDKPLTIVIAEGEPDFMHWATVASEAAEYPHATYGLLGTSTWKVVNELVSHWPASSVIIIRTHDDKAGDDCAKNIVTCLDKFPRENIKRARR